MSTDPKLENYLNRLDKALGQVPVSDRAEIVTEIKTHVLDAQARDATKSMDSILASLGEAEGVANKYLMERGLKPGRAPRGNVAKWLTIGFLGTVGMIGVFVFVLIWKFTPLIAVDESKGYVTILGGLIQIKESGDSVSIKSLSGGVDIKKQDMKGSLDLGAGGEKGKGKEILVPFTNGKFTVSTSETSRLEYSCEVVGDATEPKQSDKGVIFGFEKTVGVKCDLEVPKGKKVVLKGANGKINIRELASPVHVELTNGKVGIYPASELQYRYDLHVGNGKIDAFRSSEKKDALEVSVDVKVGSIGNDGDSG